jgi:CRP/FNR family transcriptional regulator, cyclic AMP receptor protein
MSWLLESLDPEARRAVHMAMRRRRFGREEVIYHEGDPAESLHLVVKGRVAIRTTGPTGDSLTLNILGVDDVHGELALLTDDHRRSATAVSLEASEMLLLDRGEFERLCAANPAIHRLLSVALAERVRVLSVMVQEALFSSADQRVIRRVFDLAEIYGPAVDGEVAIPIRQDVLASLAGTARPTANRVLQELQRAGCVRLARGRIIVTDLAELARLGR